MCVFVCVCECIMCVWMCVWMLIWWFGWVLVVFFCPEICSLQPFPQLHCVKTCIKYIMEFKYITEFRATNVLWKLERWLRSHEACCSSRGLESVPAPASSGGRQTPVLRQSLLHSMTTWHALTCTSSHKDTHKRVIENKTCLLKMLYESLKWAGRVRLLLDSLNSLGLGHPILFSIQCR